MRKTVIYNLILFTLLFLTNCNNTTKTPSNIRFQDFYNCQDTPLDISQLRTQFSKNNTFKISLPKDWAIIKNSNDSSSSIVGGDSTLAKIGKTCVLSITEQKMSKNNLTTLFQAEKNSIQQEPLLKLEYEGQFETNRHNGFWMQLSEVDNNNITSKNLLLYLQNREGNNLYIIQFTHSNQALFEQQACFIKNLTNTFYSISKDNA